MRIEFVKRGELNGRTMVRGSKVQVWHTLGKEKIREGVAKLYTGPWPPAKTKTDFFKPKIKNNGKDNRKN